MNKPPFSAINKLIYLSYSKKSTQQNKNSLMSNIMLNVLNSGITLISADTITKNVTSLPPLKKHGNFSQTSHGNKGGISRRQWCCYCQQFPLNGPEIKIYLLQMQSNDHSTNDLRIFRCTKLEYEKLRNSTKNHAEIC